MPSATPQFASSDSAAARLYRFVVRAREVAGEGRKQRDGWAVLFQTSPNDLELLHSGIGSFCKMIRDAKEEVRRLPDVDHDFYLAPFNEVEGLVPRINFANGLHELFGQQAMSEATIRSLRYGADAVAKSTPKRLTDESLQDLRAELSDLTEAVETKCPIELQPVLSRCIDLFKTALNHYEIFGANGIDEAVERAFGVLIKNRDVVVANKESSSLQRIWDYAVKLNTAVSIARNVRGMLKAGALTLPLLLGSSDCIPAQSGPPIAHSVVETNVVRPHSGTAGK